MVTIRIDVKLYLQYSVTENNSDFSCYTTIFGKRSQNSTITFLKNVVKVKLVIYAPLALPIGRIIVHSEESILTSKKFHTSL